MSDQTEVDVMGRRIAEVIRAGILPVMTLDDDVVTIEQAIITGASAADGMAALHRVAERLGVVTQAVILPPDPLD